MTEDPRMPKSSAMAHLFEHTTSDSPVKVSFSRSRVYQRGNLDSKRAAVAEDLDYAVVQVSLEAFIEHLLPPLKDGLDVNSTVESLEGEFPELISSEQRKWSYFSTAPKRQPGNEEAVFAHLREICRQICQLVSPIIGQVQTFQLLLRPAYTPWSEKGSTNQPDAYFTLMQSLWYAVEKDLSWYDIAIPAEFKKENTQVTAADNAIKIIFSMQQIMALDPCRRFMFGITIENTSMRLWFCSRAIVLVSEPFDFTQDLILLTRVFLSFSFASKEELGWDSTIRAIEGQNGGRVYHIDVGDKTYETSRILSDVAADNLLSRGTCVWVVRLIGSDTELVLKDVWIDDDRPSERFIYNTILSHVEAKFGKDIQERVALHLLSPVEDCFVKVNGAEDHTTGIMLRRYSPPLTETYKFKVAKTSNVDGNWSVGPPLVVSRDLHELQAYITERHLVRRKHYRIVFTQVAEPVHTIDNLFRVFLVLRDCAKVLHWIHGCGWVHRDISAGNLYFYGGRGVIGDWEYAKHKDWNMSNIHPMRTGNADFMAVEIISGQYWFRPALEISDCDDDDDDRDLPLVHNNLHDMESLWWTAIYTIFRIPGKFEGRVGAEGNKKVITNEIAGSLLFHRSTDVGKRGEFLAEGSSFSFFVAWMPASLRQLKSSLGFIRKTLVRKYLELESLLSKNQINVSEDTYCDLLRGFEDCMGCASNIRLKEIGMSTSCHLLSKEQDARDDPARDSPEVKNSLADPRKRYPDEEITSDTHSKRMKWSYSRD